MPKRFLFQGILHPFAIPVFSHRHDKHHSLTDEALRLIETHIYKSNIPNFITRLCSRSEMHFKSTAAVQQTPLKSSNLPTFTQMYVCAVACFHSVLSASFLNYPDIPNDQIHLLFGCLLLTEISRYAFSVSCLPTTGLPLAFLSH
jgi:hypothetical protein